MRKPQSGCRNSIGFTSQLPPMATRMPRSWYSNLSHEALEGENHDEAADNALCRNCCARDFFDARHLAAGACGVTPGRSDAVAHLEGALDGCLGSYRSLHL